MVAYLSAEQIRVFVRRTLMILPPILFLAYSVHSISILRSLMVASFGFHVKFANDLIQDYLEMELTADREGLIACQETNPDESTCLSGKWLDVAKPGSLVEDNVYTRDGYRFTLREEALRNNISEFLVTRKGLYALVEFRPDHQPVYWFRILGPNGEEVFRSHEAPSTWAARESFAMERSLAGCQLDVIYSSFGRKQLYSVAKRRLNWGMFLMLGTMAIFSVFLITRSIRQKILLARQKTFFVSTVSHEFKTPLAIIRLAAETLDEKRYHSEDERQTFHHMMIREINRLDLLVKKVLSFNKMETGHFSLNQSVMDLRAVVQQCVDVFQVQADADHITLEVELPDEACLVRGDTDALRLGIDNLVDNAFKYRGDSKAIVIRITDEADDWCLQVEDQGIGMTQEQSRQAIKSFFRADDPKVQAVRGSGLGLAISSYVFEQVHAKFEIRSQLGNGTCVLVRFPKQRLSQTDE